jgi:hypothetical protein
VTPDESDGAPGDGLNPNADLTYGEDFAESAEAAGISYEELLQRLLKLGIAYRADWKQFEPSPR